MRMLVIVDDCLFGVGILAGWSFRRVPVGRGVIWGLAESSSVGDRRVGAPPGRTAVGWRGSGDEGEALVGVEQDGSGGPAVEDADYTGAGPVDDPGRGVPQ